MLFRSGPAPATATRLLWRRGRRDEHAVDERVRQAAEQRLVRRLGEATELLSPAGIVVTPLDAAAANGALLMACNPDTFLPPSAELAAADQVVTATTTFTDLYGPDDPEPDPATTSPSAGTAPASPRRAPAAHGAEPARPEAPPSRRPQAAGPWLPKDEDWDYDDEIESR